MSNNDKPRLNIPMTMDMRDEIIAIAKRSERSASYICRKAIEKGLPILRSMSKEKISSLADDRSTKFSNPRVNFNIILSPELQEAVVQASEELERKKAFIGRKSIQFGIGQLSKNEIGPL